MERFDPPPPRAEVAGLRSTGTPERMRVTVTSHRRAAVSMVAQVLSPPYSRPTTKRGRVAPTTGPMAPDPKEVVMLREGNAASTLRAIEDDIRDRA
jgi:hypothetical protein